MRSMRGKLSLLIRKKFGPFEVEIMIRTFFALALVEKIRDAS